MGKGCVLVVMLRWSEKGLLDDDPNVSFLQVQHFSNTGM